MSNYSQSTIEAKRWNTKILGKSNLTNYNGDYLRWVITDPLKNRRFPFCKARDGDACIIHAGKERDIWREKEFGLAN